MCVYFVRDWRNLQFNVDSERQVLEKFFHGTFIYSQSFCRNLLSGSRRKNIFHISFLMTYLWYEPSLLRLISFLSKLLNLSVFNLIIPLRKSRGSSRSLKKQTSDQWRLLPSNFLIIISAKDSRNPTTTSPNISMMSYTNDCSWLSIWIKYRWCKHKNNKLVTTVDFSGTETWGYSLLFGIPLHYMDKRSKETTQHFCRYVFPKFLGLTSTGVATRPGMSQDKL